MNYSLLKIKMPFINIAFTCIGIVRYNNKLMMRNILLSRHLELRHRSCNLQKIYNNNMLNNRLSPDFLGPLQKQLSSSIHASGVLVFETVN